MKPAFSRLNLLMCLAISLVALGCSKNSSSSSVKLQFPDWNEMRQADLARQGKVSSLAFDATKISLLVVNITASDLKDPAFFSWENHDDTHAAPPSEISLEVPRGRSRLVQVLAVYNGDSGMSFYYADALSNFESEKADVPLELTNVASGASAMEGHIVGRYVDANGKGPTGEFEYRFSPPNKPSMVVHHGEIFGGWARFFALNSPILTYRLTKDGTELFPGRHNSSSEFFSSTKPERAMRVAIPSGYEERSGGTLFASPARREVIGFFGPGADDKRVCYNSSTVDINGLYADEAKTTKVKFYGGSGSVPSTRYAYVESVVLSSGAQVLGGNSSGSCQASGAEWEDYIALNVAQLASSESLRFRGPFRWPTGSQQGFVKTALSSSGTSLNVAWEILPGADDDIGGYGVFYRQRATNSSNNNSDSDIRLSDGYRCNDLKSLSSNPFKEIFIADKTVRSADIADITSSTVGNLQVVVCPYSNSLKRYYTSAVVAYGLGGSGCSSCSGTGGMTGSSQRLAIYQVENPQRNAQSYGTCASYRVKLTDFNGALKPASSAMSISVGHFGTSASQNFYSTSSCSGSGSTSHVINIAAGASESEIFYYRAASPGFYEMVAHADANTNTMDGWLRLGATGGGYPNELQIFGANQMAPNTCYHYSVELRSSGYPATETTAREITMAVTGISGTFYLDSNCSTAAPANKVSLPAGNYMTSVYFKPTGSPASGALTAVSSNLSAALSPSPQLGDGSLSQYVVSSHKSNNYFISGQCEEVYIRPANSVGAAIVPPTQKNLQVSISGGQIYTAATCDSTSLVGNTHALTLYSYQSGSMSFYIKNNSGSAMTLSVSDGSITSSNQIFVEAPPAGFRVANSDDSSLSGLTVNICKQVKLSALDVSNNPYSRAASYNLILTAEVSGTAQSIYLDSTCAGAAINNSATYVSMPASSSETSFYVKPTMTGSLHFNVQYAPDTQISNHLGYYSVVYQ